MSKKGNLYIISSVAGGGKTTLINKFLEFYPNFKFSVSYTSRTIRKGEKDGVNYFFVSKETFETLIQKDYFLEWEMVHNNYYGTPKKETLEVLDKGESILLDIDVKGARKVKSILPKAITIFIKPPDIEVWKKRLVDRGTESEDSLKTRIANGLKELECVNEFDCVVINDDLEIAYQEFAKILTQ